MENGWPRPDHLPSLQRLVGKLCKQFLYKSSIDINRHMGTCLQLVRQTFQQSWSKNMKFKLLWFSRVFNGQKSKKQCGLECSGVIWWKYLNKRLVYHQRGFKLVFAVLGGFLPSQLLSAHPIAMTGTPETPVLKGTSGWAGCHAMGKTCLHMSFGGNRNRFRILKV